MCFDTKFRKECNARRDKAVALFQEARRMRPDVSQYRICEVVASKMGLTASGVRYILLKAGVYKNMREYPIRLTKKHTNYEDNQ